MPSNDILIDIFAPSASLHGDIRVAIRAEFKRTGLNPRLFLKDRRDIPIGLDAREINGWLRGQTSEADARNIAFVMSALSALPSASGIVHKSKSGPRSRTGNHARIAITPEMVMELRREMDRTNAPMAILEQFHDRFPEGFTPSLVKNWLTIRARTAWKDHWDFVVECFRSISKGDGLPTEPHGARRKLFYRSFTISEMKVLRAHRRRTDIGGVKLLKQAAEKPDGLTGNMIDGWMQGTIKTALPAHIDFVIGQYHRTENLKRKPKRLN